MKKSLIGSAVNKGRKAFSVTGWIEISYDVDGEGAEALSDMLNRYVHQGVAIEQPLPQEVWPDELPPADRVIVRAYIADDARSPELLKQIREASYYLSRIYPAIPEPQLGSVRDEDWADAWKKHYHPIRVGQHFLIRPAWIEMEPGEGDILIEMDPGMAFGTGTHPTTQLMLEACEAVCQPGLSVIDVGSGSGILSIAAAKLGCEPILGREIEPQAIKVSQENLERNGVADKATMEEGSIDDLAGKVAYDIGLANITARIICDLLPAGLAKLVKIGAPFVFSGIIDDQAEEMIARLKAEGLALERIEQRGDWIALYTRRFE